MRAEHAAPPLWIGSLAVSAVLALRADVPTPPAIEIIPGEPPAVTVQAIVTAQPAPRCSDGWLQYRVDTLIDFQVRKQRSGHLGTDERYIVGAGARVALHAVHAAALSRRDICVATVGT